jgi:hypothetical protein
VSDFLPAVVAAFKARHGRKPSEIVVGPGAAVALAAKRQLWAEASGVCVVTRPLVPADRPAPPGDGSRMFVDLERDRLRAFELA